MTVAGLQSILVSIAVILNCVSERFKTASTSSLGVASYKVERYY